MLPVIFIIWLLSLAAIPHVLLARKRPVSALAWVWGIILFPGLGAVTYFMLGADRMRRKRIRKAERARLPRHGASPRIGEHLASLRRSDRVLVQLLSTINEIPASTADEVTFLENGREFYPALEKEIDAARHHVHIEFFIWQDDECGAAFRDRLVAAAQRGVEVRLLLDQIGCWSLPKSFFAPLIAAGGRMSWFYSLPLWKHSRFMNLRNHRKLQIIDGDVAFVGGMNLGREHLGRDEEAGEWRDAQVRLRGGVLTYLQEIFATDWFFATEERLDSEAYFPERGADGPYVVQVIAGGPDIPRESVTKTFIALLGAAKKRVWITTGYFVPDALFLTALQMCAARGVDVRLIIAEKTDHPFLVLVGRSFYEELIEWGVRVFEYERATNHKKTVLYDDEWLMVGSANSDNRSMRLNFELNVFAHAPKEAARLAGVLETEFADSDEIKLESLQNRPLRKRLVEAACRLLAPML